MIHVIQTLFGMGMKLTRNTGTSNVAVADCLAVGNKQGRMNQYDQPKHNRN